MKVRFDALLPLLRRASLLGPGLVDAGLSSLASFAAGVVAARTLGVSALGAYALYFSAVNVASLLPQHLLFLPSQVRSLELPREARPAALRGSWLPGLGLSLLTLPFASAAGVLVHGQVPDSTLATLATGACLLILVSPLQDHVRSLLYLADSARAAAAVSAWQLAITLAALALFAGANVDPAWSPFTALALGNLGSAIAGIVLMRAGLRERVESQSLRDLARAGRVLLPAAAIQESSIFAASALLGVLASSRALGHAEAARIVSRPVQVFSLGVSRAMAPRLMEAGQAGSPARSRQESRLYAASLLIAGLAYLLLTAWPHPLNPATVVATAYELRGLVALFVLASLAGTIAQIPRGVLLGAGRNRDVLAVSNLGAVTRVAAVGLLASTAGAYAVPVAQVLAALLSGWYGARASNRAIAEVSAGYGRSQA